MMCLRPQIVHWAGCHHTLCVQCVIQHFRDEAQQIVDKGQLPQCPVAECKEEVSMFTLKTSWYANPKVNFPWDSSLNSSVGGDLGVHAKLRELLHSKHGTGFYCAHCHEWHANEEGVAWSGCGHRYGRTCALKMVQEVIGDPTNMNTDPSWQYSLSKRPLVPRCEAIVGVLNQGHPTLPIQPKYCIAALQETEAAMVGATHYQQEVIRNLNAGVAVPPRPFMTHCGGHHEDIVGQCMKRVEGIQRGTATGMGTPGMTVGTTVMMPVLVPVGGFTTFVVQV